MLDVLILAGILIILGERVYQYFLFRKLSKIQEESGEEGEEGITIDFIPVFQQALGDPTVQEVLHIAINNALVKMASVKENQEHFGNFLKVHMSTVLNDLMPEIQTQLTGGGSLSEEDQADAQQLIGKFGAEALAQNLPDTTLALIESISPTWKKDFETNPAKATFVIRGLQRLGVFGVVEKFMDGVLGPTNPKPGVTPGIPKSGDQPAW